MGKGPAGESSAAGAADGDDEATEDRALDELETRVERLRALKHELVTLERLTALVVEREQAKRVGGAAQCAASRIPGPERRRQRAPA